MKGGNVMVYSETVHKIRNKLNVTKEETGIIFAVLTGAFSSASSYGWDPCTHCSGCGLRGNHADHGTFCLFLPGRSGRVHPRCNSTFLFSSRNRHSSYRSSNTGAGLPAAAAWEQDGRK